MTLQKGLVLDANILLRAVFGVRVRHLLELYEDSVHFCAPDVCFQDAREYIPAIAARKRIDPSLATSVLNETARIVAPVDSSLYESHKELALERIQSRDADDWPVLAVALLLSLPIWTEDQDFFGSGVPSWTTDRVEIYLRDHP